MISIGRFRWDSTIVNWINNNYNKYNRTQQYSILLMYYVEWCRPNRNMDMNI